MKQVKKEIYIETLKSILEETRVPPFNGLRKRLNKTSERKMIYIQGDPDNEIWELLKLAGKYWKCIELFNEHADFIRSLEPFSWFCTLTFKSDIHPEQANRYFFKWIRKLNEIIVGKRYRNKHIPGNAWVRAMERQKKGVLHFHCLIDHPNIDKVTFAEAKKIWEMCGRKTGRINHFVRYDKKRGACGYLGKYVMKNGEIDYSPKITWHNRPHRRNVNFQSKTN